jgi:DNA-binding SARP family transcriptional activator/energy-coupling factor transporter ATP-binding protein EcfA2
VEFSVLGPLEVRRDGSNVPLGSFKQRSLLALLLIHANQVVSTDRIIDELWGDDPATGHQNALWVHISHLRTALEPDREKRSEGTVLLTRAPGYQLKVEPAELDAWKFEQLMAEGRGLLDSDPGTASLVIGEALALWHGRPYADVTYESFAQAEIGRLDELRLESVELRLDADLRRGLASELIGELEALARQYPTRERFTEQLMVSLYRSGRQADALRAFGRLRTRLGEDLGIEPSASTRALEERIVVGDPSLDRSHEGVGAASRLAIRGYEMRELVGEGRFGPIYRAFQPTVGQEVAVEVVRPELADDPGFIRRFDAEADAVARLDHPSIVPLHDHWREPGAAYLVTGLVPGVSLAESVRRRPMPPVEGARLVADLAGAVTQARRNGLHDRVTVDKVAIDSKGRAHLRDFGLRFTDTDELTEFGTTSAERTEDQADLARVLEFAITGGSPVADADVPSSMVDVIRRAASPGNGHRDLGSFAAAVQSAIGLATPPEAPGPGNPYKGLRPFEESDAADFFGRERVVERLLGRLGEGGIRGRFVVLVGPSGSGKSSVVKAGLLAALRRGALPGSTEWFITTMTPGEHPFEELEAALLRVAVNPPPSLLEQLTDGESGIRRAVRRVLPDDQAQLLLVIDQFEELFTQTPDATTQKFLEALAAAVDDPGGRLRVVATLRADFYDRPLRHRDIGELVRRGTEVITPLSPAEVERSITGPVEGEGIGFEPGLVAQIVADVAEHPAALPLLQYALTELYERRRDRLIRMEDYVALGGLAAVLARRAETLYADLDPLSQRAARQVMLRLVAVGDDADDLRRRVLRSELLAVGEGAGTVLDVFGRHRLLSFDRDPVTRGPTVEIAHEALIGEWGRLRRWIELSRDDLRMQRRLATGAAEWLATGRDAEYLLGGTRLDQTAEWSGTTDLSLDGVERSFLEESLAQRDRVRAAEETRSRHEERLRLRTRSRTRLLGVSGAVLAALAALAGFAFVQRNQAARLAGELDALGEIARLTSASSLVAESDPELSALLALQSVDASARAGIPATAETEEALHWALQAARVAYPVAEAPIDVRSGPHGLTGIYRLPLDELVAMTKSQLVNGALTAEECQRYGITPCPENSSTWPALAAEPNRPDVPSERQPLAGTQVSLVGEMPPEGLVDELTRFEEATGIEVSYELPPGPLEAQIQYTGATPIDLGIAP